MIKDDVKEEPGFILCLSDLQQRDLDADVGAGRFSNKKQALIKADGQSPIIQNVIYKKASNEKAWQQRESKQLNRKNKNGEQIIKPWGTNVEHKEHTGRGEAMQETWDENKMTTDEPTKKQ